MSEPNVYEQLAGMTIERDAALARLAELAESVAPYVTLAAGEAETCICVGGPATSGPEQDCPTHGDVRWYAHWCDQQKRRAETAEAEVEQLKTARTAHWAHLAAGKDTP